MPNGQKKTAHAGRESIRYGVAFLILLILLVQLFQTVGTRLAVKCDKRLKK